MDSAGFNPDKVFENLTNSAMQLWISNPTPFYMYTDLVHSQLLSTKRVGTGVMMTYKIAYQFEKGEIVNQYVTVLIYRFNDEDRSSQFYRHRTNIEPIDSNAFYVTVAVDDVKTKYTTPGILSLRGLEQAVFNNRFSEERRLTVKAKGGIDILIVLGSILNRLMIYGDGKLRFHNRPNLPVSFE